MTEPNDEELRITDLTESSVPMDRLTTLADRMCSVLENDPECDDVQAIVFLHDDNHGGIEVHGYEDTSEAMIDLLVHLKALFQTQGQDLRFVGVNENGVSDLL